jgi:hypothetical protein
MKGQQITEEMFLYFESVSFPMPLTEENKLMIMEACFNHTDYL